MSLPFSREQFLDVFKNYNESIWPLPLAFAIVAFLTVVAATRRQGAYGYVVFPILAAMWLVNGLGYHILFFSAVNPIAKVFGTVFARQCPLRVDNRRHVLRNKVHGIVISSSKVARCSLAAGLALGTCYANVGPLLSAPFRYSK